LQIDIEGVTRLTIEEEIIVSRLIELLDKNHTLFFNKTVKKTKSLECFIVECLRELQPLNKETVDHHLTEIRKQRNRTKKRWYKIFSKEWEKVLEGVLDTVILEKLKKTYQKELVAAQEWVNDHDRALTTFKLIENRQKVYQIKAFKVDIKESLLQLLKKEFDGSIKGCFIEVPLDIIGDPIFSMKRHKIEMQLSSSGLAQNEYHVSENYFLNISTRMASNEIIQKEYTLDQRDAEIVNFIYNKIEPQFYTDRSVTVDIRELVLKIHKTASSYSYKDVEDRLLRLTNYKIDGIVKNEDGKSENKFSIVFFPSVKIINDPETNKKISIIRFNEDLYEAFLKRQTVKVASSQYNVLNDPLSRLILFPLQKERLSLWGKGDKSLEMPLTIDFFERRVRFRSKSRSVNFELIKKALTCMQNGDSILKQFNIVDDPVTHKPEAFLVEFKHLTRTEVKLLGVLGPNMIKSSFTSLTGSSKIPSLL